MLNLSEFLKNWGGGGTDVFLILRGIGTINNLYH